ncbi:hypothetical protein KIW84_056636 [Lathyrus oleraceus]|uniref:Uncharacterized protein n=1 Tax=Pisum sativum TaxID=3888 RepID=A0A9D4X154_PEA|nr:hypothetical protein KIW84_056636 [Pisum sativum]
MNLSSDVHGFPEASVSDTEIKPNDLPSHNGFEHVHVAYLDPVAGVEFEKDRRTQKSMLRAVGQIEIRAGLMDAHCQLKSEELLNDTSQAEEIGIKKGIFPKKSTKLSQIPVTAGYET